MSKPRKTFDWVLRVFGVLLIAGIILAMTVFRNRVIKALAPLALDLQRISDWEGYLLIGGIIFVLQFPPLFGAEILMLFAGFVYGLWRGYVITTIGMLAGETALFLIARHTCTSFIEKHLKKNEWYTGMSVVILEGGSWMIFLIRLSALPVHFTTLAFGFMSAVPFWSWFVAGIISSPKILAEIYLGSSYTDINDPVETPHAKLVSDIAFGVKIAVSAVLAGYLYWRFGKVQAAAAAKASIENNDNDIYDDEVPLTNRVEDLESRASGPKPYVPALYSTIPGAVQKTRPSDEYTPPQMPPVFNEKVVEMQSYDEKEEVDEPL